MNTSRSQSHRLSTGGHIDRSRLLKFSFDGREFTGFAGDTLASALLANGVRVTGRSFKYHRPRGIVGSGFEEPNTLVQLGTGARTEPNLKATQVELFEGLSATAVNCWPSARFDLLGLIRWFKALMPSGFYYKTFIWPSWHLFEPLIRAAAGLGRSPREPDPDRYDKRHESVDVLVVGGGIAGIEAATAAARVGQRVVLMHDRATLDLQIAAEPNLQVLTRCTAFGYYDNDHVVAVQHLAEGSGSGAVRQRLWHVRCKEVVLATGAIERPMVFPNNDRPGAMLASAAREYLQRYGVAVGRRVVIATNNDSAYEVASLLRTAGIEVVALIDSREQPGVSAPAGLRVELSSAPTNTHGSKGIRSIEVHRVDAAGKAVAGTAQIISCDALLMSGGWNPTVHLLSQAGGSLQFNETLQAFVPARAGQHERAIGAAAGHFESPLNTGPLQAVDVSALGRTPAYSWVDFASDVTEADLQLATREGFGAVEHLKRYTTTGMMADQGKTSNVNAIGVLAGIAGKAPAAVGTTKFRPPFNPVTFGAIAGPVVGEHYHPLRRLPTDALQRTLGARFEDFGGWSRPVCLPRSGENESGAIEREVRSVREGVGIIDYSPLGKILVRGPDAATFLQRIYVNNMKTLKPGSCRYGLMLSEHGIVFDDGVVTRWDEQTFQVGTTSGHAEAVADMLEEWLQCEWLDLDVIVEPITTQWATIMVAGPKARALMHRLGIEGIDLSPQAFPHMTAREGRLGDVSVRIARVSFTGELSYEVSVPWSRGAALWTRLLEQGRDLGVMPFGIESLMVMRVEKGFLHVGTETDGTTMPQDIGFKDIIEKKTDDFVGRRSLTTPEGRRGDRQQLVGLASAELLPIGAHITGPDPTAPAKSQGWVTSSVFSPTLKRAVAMAVIARGTERMGETVKVFDVAAARVFDATIVLPVAYDPNGERLHV